MDAWVYKYRFWDPDQQAYVTSEQMFTLEAIRAGLGVAIIESGMRVQLDQLDPHGKLRRPSVTH